jgi:photosystem II stability/assembly factor-like uncharacterized protein
MMGLMRRALLFALLTLAPGAASAIWTNIGPFGGDARSLASDSAGNTVFVLNPRTGVFRSAFGGPWTLVFDALQRGVVPTRVAVDSQNGRAYIGATTGLYRSDDSGLTWKLVTSDPIVDVAAAGDRVIASTPQVLERSPNAGGTWTNINSPGSDNFNTVSRILIDPRSVERVLAINQGKLFLSGDLGNTWDQLPVTNIVAAIFADTIYAGGPAGLFSCETTCNQIGSDPVIDVTYFQGLIHVALPDGVLRFVLPRWERLISGFPNATPRSLLGTPRELLVGTTAGVYSTTDDVNWVNRSDGLSNVHITAMALAGGSLFAGTLEQSVMRRSADVWTTADNGLARHAPALPLPRALASDGSTIYAAFLADGLFRSTDQGRSWNDITAGLPSRDVLDVAADPGIVVAATGAGLVKSNDLGTTWQPFKNYPGITADIVAVRGSTVMAAKATTVYASTDGGNTWQSGDLPSPVVRIAIAGSHLYATTDTDVFVNNGGGWSHAALPSSIVHAITASGSYVFVSLASGIFRSSDGVSWTLVPQSDTLPPDITSLAVDATTLYAGTNGGSIFATSLVPPRLRAVRH